MDNEVFRIEIPVEAIDRTEPALGQAQNNLSRFERSMRNTEEQMGRMNRTRMQLIISALDKASGTIAGVLGRARSLAGRTYSFSVKVLDLATRPIKAIMNFATSTIGMMTAGAGIAGGIVIPMKIAGDFEQTQIAFTTMLHSASAAKDFLDKAQDLANKTPFEFPDLANSSKKLLAFGWNVKQILPDLTVIGDTSAGLGLGADGIDRITMALGQMKAKGKVMGDEILQLTEAGVPAAKILQEQLGLSADQVANIGKQGLSADKAINALLKGMNKRFGGMMQQQSATALGLLSTLKDTFSNKLLKQWGAGLWDGVKPGLLKVTNWLDKNDDKVKQWGNLFREVGGDIAKWVTASVGRIATRIRDLTNSTEWKNATTLGEKIKLAWDKVISEPFNEWWSGKGKAWVTKAAASIGGGLGGALGGFIMSALGVAQDPSKAMKQSPFISAGATAGKAFLDSFLAAFDAGQIAKKAASVFTKSQSNLGKFVPGGQGPDIGAWATAALDAYLLVKGGKGAYKLFKNGKGAVEGIKGIKNFFKGGSRAAAGAAEATGTAAAAAETAATASNAASHTVPRIITGAGEAAPRATRIFGANGEVLRTVTRDTTAAARVAETVGETTQTMSRVGKIAGLIGKASKVKAIPVVGTVLGLAGSAITIASASKKDRGKAIAGEAGSWVGSIGAGAALGAAGGAIGGSIVPVAGTAIGAAIGGIVGGIGGAIGGEKFSKWLYSKFTGGSKAKVEKTEKTDAYAKSVEKMTNQTGLVYNSQGNLITKNGELAGSQATLAKSLYALANTIKQVCSNIANTKITPTPITSPITTPAVTFPSFGIPTTPSKTPITVKKHATGGIMTSPHMGLVAEAGPEAIIPLSDGRRQRGIDIWQKTGRFLGVQSYAKSGNTGEKPESKEAAPTPTYVPTSGGKGKQAITIKVEAQASPQYQISTTAGASDVIAAIRAHQTQIADELSNEIAEKLAAIFGNMPEVEGA